MWSWLRGLRVWTASVKAFLQPENWLDPDDGKRTRRRRRRLR